jgi:hypothetical protein
MNKWKIAVALILLSTFITTSYALEPVQSEEESETKLLRALSDLHPDAWIRVEIKDGERFDGRVIPRGSTLVIEDLQGSHEVDQSSVESIAIKIRSFWAGAAIGGGVGAAAGLGLAAIYVAAYGEAAIFVLPFTTVSGAIVGAVIGGPVGGAVPKWKPYYNSVEGRIYYKPVAPTTPRGFIGSGMAQIGFSGSPDDHAPGGSGSAQVGVYSRLGRVVGLGPELGHYRLGAGEYVTRFTLNGRFSTPTEGWRVYTVGGIGVYWWHFERSRYGPEDPYYRDGFTHNFLGFNAGLGGSLDLPQSPVEISAEFRLHTDFHDEHIRRNFDLLTGTVGVDLGW